MKLCGYVRVSTEAQADKGMGLHVQRDSIARWAANNGHTIAKWAEDAGESGSNGMERRTGLAEAFGCLGERPRRVTGIVVARLDRFARELVLQETLLAEVRRLKGRVFSCAAGEDAYLEDDPGDPSRTLVRQILGAVSQYERAMIRLRLDAGMARKRAEGGYVGGGIPYGWEVVDAELREVPAEQDVLRIIDLARRDGRSWRYISKMLNDLGVPTKRGGRWHENTVRRIHAARPNVGRVHAPT